jgi:hypothetical protein
MGALQLRRGAKSALPVSALEGEPLIAMDTRELYIGTGSSVIKVGDVIFNSVQPTVVAGKIWIDLTTNEIYRASDDGLSWTKCAGAVDLSAYFLKSDISTDVALGGALASDAKVASQKAVKAFVENAVTQIKIPQEWPDSALDYITTPPGSPVTGDRYLIKSVATGAWAGQENAVAEFDGAAWVFKAPTTGTFISVDADATGLFYFGGTSWSKKSFELNTAGAGIDITAGVVSLSSSVAGAGLDFTAGVLSIGTLDGGSF